jgi:hypothetical protein
VDSLLFQVDMRIKTTKLTLGLLLFSAALGCRSFDPAARFIAKTDCEPESSRPKNWEQTKRLMARPVPAVGEPAPNFTLPMLDSTQMVTRVSYQGNRPLVLIFGSFT